MINVSGYFCSSMPKEQICEKFNWVSQLECEERQFIHSFKIQFQIEEKDIQNAKESLEKVIDSCESNLPKFFFYNFQIGLDRVSYCPLMKNWVIFAPYPEVGCKVLE